MVKTLLVGRVVNAADVLFELLVHHQKDLRLNLYPLIIERCSFRSDIVNVALYCSQLSNLQCPVGFMLLLLTVVLGSLDHLLECMLVAHESLVVLEQKLLFAVLLLNED